MATDGGRYSIGDLAGLAGATARTIRYYVAQGLLPPPAGVGAGAHYTDDHLARLRLIRRLQRQHQPLSEIRQRLAALGEEDVAALVATDAAAEEAPPSDSALEYLRSVLVGRERTTTIPPASAPSQPAPAAPAAPAPAAPAPIGSPADGGPMPSPSAAGSPGLPRLALRRAIPALRVAADAPAPRQPEPSEPSEPSAAPTAHGGAEAQPSEQRSQWDRIGLTPNIEIHVRRPLGRLENRRVERLITIGRQLLREEQP